MIDGGPVAIYGDGRRVGTTDPKHLAGNSDDLGFMDFVGIFARVVNSLGDRDDLGREQLLLAIRLEHSLSPIAHFGNECVLLLQHLLDSGIPHERWLFR